MRKSRDNYDFDLIISSEELRKNKEKISKQNLEKTRKKYKLKIWIKVFLLLLIGALIGVTIYQLFTVKTTRKTPVGNYMCRGGIVQICTANSEVSDYLGV